MPLFKTRFTGRAVVKVLMIFSGTDSRLDQTAAGVEEAINLLIHRNLKTNQPHLGGVMAAEVCSIKKIPYESKEYQVECTEDLEIAKEVKRSSSEMEMIKMMSESGYELKAQILRPYWSNGDLNRAVNVWTFINN